MFLCPKTDNASDMASCTNTTSQQHGYMGAFVVAQAYVEARTHQHVCVHWLMRYALYAPGGYLESYVACARVLDMRCTVVYLSFGHIGQRLTIHATKPCARRPNTAARGACGTGDMSPAPNLQLATGAWS